MSQHVTFETIPPQISGSGDRKVSMCRKYFSKLTVEERTAATQANLGAYNFSYSQQNSLTQGLPPVHALPRYA